MPQLRVQAHARQYRSKRTTSPGTSPCLPPLPELLPRDAEVTKQGGKRLGPEVLGRVAMHGSPLPLAVANDEVWGALAPKVRPEVPEHGHQFAVLEFRELFGAGRQTVTSSTRRADSARMSSSTSG